MMSARTKLTSTSQKTREQLILAGERLFAELGLDNVSLRQINVEAGQKNSSASHYHFGSKDALIRAIYEYRMESLDRRRQTMLERLPPATGTRPVVTLIECLVHPLVEEIESTEGGRQYIQFMAQMMSHPMLNLVTMWRDQFGASVGHVYYELRRTLPDIPDEVFGPRFGLMWVLVINALADRERLSETSAAVISHALPVLFVSNLVDTATGLISAPVSTTTQTEVQRLRAGIRQLA
jgi:AcrR family transcriptional regulator